MEQKKSVVIIYEVGQIAEIQSYLKQEGISLDVCTVIPLEFQVERALQEAGIPYASLTQYVPIEEEFGDVLQSARSSAKHFHEHSAMQFYYYQGINLGEVFEPMLDYYLQHLGRYLGILKRIAEASEIKKLYIPYPVMQLSSNAGALVSYSFLSPVDATTAVGRRYGFEVQTIGAPPGSISVQKKQQIARRLALHGLAMYNTLIDLFVFSRPLKIYASEYWSHISSFIERMDDVELVLMERSQIKNIPWRQLLKHRIRFLHPSDVIDANARQNITQAVADFSKQWHSVKSEIREVFALVPGIDAWSEVERALTHLIETQTIHALIDIEGLKKIMQKEKPDKVLLRASIGGSAHHFFIATQVAHQLGIPSIELQHAGAIVDPRSVHYSLTASYLAAYGPLMRDLHVKHNGYAPERIRAIGSPRFDHYVHERDILVRNRNECLRGLGLDPARPTVFAAVPFPGAFPLVFSSYQVAAFFSAFRNAQKKIPELQCIFKFRYGDFSPFYQNYVHELFTDDGVAVTNTINFLPLIVASDIACTGKSTILYEIMLGKKPVILYPWQKWDTYALAVYNRVAPVAFDEDELSALLRVFLNKTEAEEAINKQNKFLTENYRFDGHAPERMAALLREKLLPLP